MAKYLNNKLNATPNESCYQGIGGNKRVDDTKVALKSLDDSGKASGVTARSRLLMFLLQALDLLQYIVWSGSGSRELESLIRFP